MSGKNSVSKEFTYQKILDTVLRLEVEKGHLSWRISDLSRFSGVQRSLIYYYFGKSRSDILKVSLQIFAETNLGISRGAFRKQLFSSVLAARNRFHQSPYILQFYLRWRHAGCEIGQLVRSLEAAYQKRLEMTFPKLNSAQREAVYTLLFGLMSVPVASKRAIAISLQALEKQLQ